MRDGGWEFAADAGKIWKAIKPGKASCLPGRGHREDMSYMASARHGGQAREDLRGMREQGDISCDNDRGYFTF